MHINDFYEYNLRPEDVPKNKFTGVIGEIREEKKWIPKSNQFQKCPVLYFRNKDGSLNPTGWIVTRPNLRDIGDLYGPVMDVWPGKRITLYKHTGSYGGQQRTVFRVEKKVPPEPKKKKKKEEEQQTEPEQQADPEPEPESEPDPAPDPGPESPPEQEPDDEELDESDDIDLDGDMDDVEEIEF